jgi:type I restriction enzyme, S subunit
MALYGQGKTRGKVGLLGIEASTNQACAAICLNRNVSPEFIFQSLASQYEAIRNLSNTGNQENLNGAIVRSIPILLPPESEQRAIAAALGDVDALLGALTRLIAKKRDLKQTAMQQLLTGQIRLPGFSREWEVSTVGREFDIQLGKMLDADRNRGMPKPYIGNKAVQWNRIEIGDLPMVPMSRSDLDRFRLVSGDLLVCEGGEAGRAAIWEGPIDECYYQKALHRLRPLRGFNSRLMVELLRHWADGGRLVNYVTQTSIAHLTREKLAEVPMPVPQPDEQRAIVGVLSNMDANITALEHRLAKTRALKQGMMQELLTGRTRLV